MLLDEVINWIDEAFGDEAVMAADIEALKGLFGDGGYEGYLQDQVNRQIIRDYLINAVVLGIISKSALAAFATQVSTEDGRAVLALHMLMSSIEDAADLAGLSGNIEALKPLSSPPEPHPHIKLVPN